MAGTLLLPVFYVASLAAVFLAFVRWNRGKQRIQTDTYFGPHSPRAIYEELAEQWSPEDPNGAQLLKTALLKRAMEDVRRILHIKEQKPGLANLVRQGVMGDDVLQKLLEAEADLEQEIALVLEEAELYRQGWKEVIFQEATQLYQHYLTKESEEEAKEIAATRQRLEARMKEQFEEEHDNTKTEISAEEMALKAAEELLAEEEDMKKKTNSNQKKNKKKK